jgi:hypothetical protein
MPVRAMSSPSESDVSGVMLTLEQFVNGKDET